MKDTSNYTEEQYLSDVRANLGDNLDVFKRKFLLFFIGLIGMALSIVLYAFGAGGWGCIPMLALVVTWCGPLVVKFWFSGFGALFDFQYKEYEIDQYGNKRDVSKIDSVLVGPFLKCMFALVVALIALYLVPAEIIVRLFNHIKFEKKLGEKGTIFTSPRREAVLSAIVLVAMIVVAAIGGAITKARENTSDMGKEEIAQIIETLDAKSKSYTINSLYSYNTESTSVCATVVEQNGVVTFTSVNKLEYYQDGLKYTIPVGVYTYRNGAWIDADENVAVVLSSFTIGLAFDLDAMKTNTDSFVINEEDDVMGGRIDSSTHDCYQLRPKDNGELQFDDFYVAKDFSFAAWSSQNYIFVFDNET